MPSTRPLAGYCVVEIGHSVAGPYVGMILAELGAEVIKVEPPGTGDHARGWGPPFHDGVGTTYQCLNRNKSGVTVDLADPEQAAALRRLILERADAVACNLRAGVAERYGIGAEALVAQKPGLVYCEIGAFGKRGPLAGMPGYDPLMQAYGGIMSVTGEGADRPPVRVGVSIVDMGAGLWSAIGILAALLERGRTGRGGLVETSLFEVAAAWATVPIAGYLASGEVRRPHGSGVAEIVPYEAFRASDGWLMVAAGNDGLFAKLMAVLGRPELGQDPRFRRNADRVRHRDEIISLIAAALVQEPIAVWRERLDRVGVPNAPIQTVDQVVGCEQAAALGIVQEGPPGALATVGLPLSFDGERAPYARRAPRLGEHNEEVFGAPPRRTAEEGA